MDCCRLYHCASLQTCVREVQGQPLDSDESRLSRRHSLLSGLVYARETVSAILFEEGLMDIIRESPVAQYLTQQGKGAEAIEYPRRCAGGSLR